MPKAGRVVVALTVTAVLLLSFVLLLTMSQGLAPVAAQDSTYHTLRVYGRGHEGAGDPSATDPCTDRPPEDPPYTLPEPIFNPQLWQAPVKDSITWDPAFMSEFETFDEIHAKGLYNHIFAGSRNATEKVWFRMWYEPWHWDKDLNANGELDIDPCTDEPIPDRPGDEWYPAVMQEFTYLLMEADLLQNEPEPLAGPVGQTSFVFPVGMREGDLFASDGTVDTTSANARYGYGLTSLDGDFDGIPDIVHVESELTLLSLTGVGADLNGNGLIDPLDTDAVQLNGNELAIFRLDAKRLSLGQAVQFLDHFVIVKEVLESSALLEVWYTGDMTPRRLGTMTLYIGDMLLSGTSAPVKRIVAGGNNLCEFPTGPFFAYLQDIDIGERKARLMVGRGLGATWSGMEGASASQLDLCPGDPWFLKRFYVDGHEYNVVAIKTELGAPVSVGRPDCETPRPVADPTWFKFITIRTPVPKEGVYDDPLTGHVIEQHSVRLQPYAETNELSVMPPFNHEHYIVLDVQAQSSFTCDEDDVDYFGKLVGPVPPILQQNGPFPYQGVGPYSPYTDRREMSLFYVEEDKNLQFLGELKEKYGECSLGGSPAPTGPEGVWATAPAVYPDCNFRCGARDISVTDVWMGDATGNGLCDCRPGTTVDAYVWVEVTNNTGSSRCAFWLKGDLYINGAPVDSVSPSFQECVADSLSGGSTTRARVDSISWTCGSEAELRDVVLSWETSCGGASPPTCAAPVPPDCPPGGQCWSASSIRICETPVTAEAYASPLIGCAPLRVAFRGTASGGASPYSYSWDFDDGGTSDQQSPTHTYATAGTYTATLTVVDASGAADTDTVVIRVRECDGEVVEECWYVEQWHTLPWEYTEFVLPDLNPAHIGRSTDLYLLTSAFLAPQSEQVLWTQDVPTDTTWTHNVSWDADADCWVRDDAVDNMPPGWQPRVKFWFDPAEGGKKYKSETGLRIYGFDAVGPGDPDVYDHPNPPVPAPPGYPVEVLPYTDPWAPFNPQLPQAPPKDSLTFNPAYMDKFYHGNESLARLYEQISIREHDAREKVFLRMWYEPEYLDKILKVDPNPPFMVTQVYTFPALMQEFTYMYLDTRDQPAHGPPGSSTFAFPMATAAGQLPKPDPSTGNLPATQLPSFGWGLTTFDANFDGEHDIVHVHSEETLFARTNIRADFNGDGSLNNLNPDTLPLSGDEMVVFALEDMLVRLGESVQFLDHMVTLDNVSPGPPGRASLQLWYTGGGLHAAGGGQYSLHPDKIGSPRTLQVGEMIIVNKSTIRQLPAGGSNLGSADGAWFVYVNAVNSASETVSVIVGRALGHTWTAMDDGNGNHDLLPGDPWYLKRFFVDGHEYNVVAVHAVSSPTGDPELKYVTIRTPVPKENFVNYEDSQKLEGYFLGTVLGVDTSVVSVMPPFNFEHTVVDDIQALPEKDLFDGEEEFVFANEHFYDSDCRGELIKNVPPVVIAIVDEDREPQFFGELKEKYWEEIARPPEEIWQTEQWHTVPDQYTELRLPRGQKYLLTSDWESEQSRVYYYDCCDGDPDPISLCHPDLPVPNTDPPDCTNQSPYFEASEAERLRVKFWYDPADHRDIYVNTWQGPGPQPTPTPTATPTRPPGATGTIRGKVTLQGRTDHSGAVVRAGGVSDVTDADGLFTLSEVPQGIYDVRAEMAGYLDHVKSGVQVTAFPILQLPDVQLLGGDANNDCLVNVFDLVIVAWNYGSSPPSDSRADINGNNVVDIFDLVMVGRNLDQSCPGAWPSPAMVAPQSMAPAHLRVLPEGPVLVPVGGLVKVTLGLEEVVGLWGVDVQLSFDPDILEVVDADPARPGVQIHRGTFPDPELSQVAKEAADNEAGSVWYALALRSPAEPLSGDGTLCAITFRAKAAGTSALAFESATLSDQQAVELDVLTHEGSVAASEEYALQYLPIIIKAGTR